MSGSRLAAIIRSQMDVAIVGGGPAGLLVAARCAEAGLDVLLFEADAVIGEPTHCTGVISLETAELAKVPDEIILQRLGRARLRAPGGRSCDIAWDGDGREQILAIDRAAFDQGLAARAAEAGAVICTGVPVSRVTVGADGVELEAGQGVLRARACVLACGVTYRFQRQLGLGLPSEVVHTAQLEVDAEPSDCVELYFGRRVAPDGFAWLTPISRAGRHRLKVGVIANGDAGAALDRLLARPEVRGRLGAEPGKPLRRLLPLKPIARTYAPRVLVVGDAGGFTKPTTGGGIFYSLLTASLAAQTLVEAFQEGRFDAGFLSRYERRWQEQLGGELRVAAWFRHLATRLGDAEIDAVVAALAADDVQAMIRGMGRFNWHGELILTLLRQRRLASLLFRALFR
jgi:geranylgeranyl reductase family protein